MKLVLVSLMSVFALGSVAQAADVGPEFISKGHKKITLRGSFVDRADETSYSLGGSYKKFVTDKWVIGPSLSLSGSEGNVLAGFSVGAHADYYFYKNKKGAFFVGLSYDYLRGSFKNLGDKTYFWLSAADLEIAYDYFLSKSVALTPSLYYQNSLEDSGSVASENRTGVRVRLSVFL